MEEKIMSKYEINGIVKFANGKSYIILDSKKYQDRTYLSLATTAEPLEVLFTEVMADDTLKPIQDQDLKVNLLKLFYKQNVGAR